MCDKTGLMTLKFKEIIKKSLLHVNMCDMQNTNQNNFHGVACCVIYLLHLQGLLNMCDMQNTNQNNFHGVACCVIYLLHLQGFLLCCLNIHCCNMAFKSCEKIYGKYDHGKRKYY